MKNQHNFNDKNGKFAVTLVGYGRYGNYIGPKYARDGFPWEMASIVDPALTRDVFAESVLGRKKPGTALHRGFDDWHREYFLQLTEEQRQGVVVEFALPAAIVCELALQFIEAGVRQIILPKPVVETKDDLRRLLSAVKRHGVKAAVASQWYYSSIPRIIGRDLKRLTSRSPDPAFALDRITIEFSKENGQAIAPAPLCELPHALQILHSAGLLRGGRQRGMDSAPHSVTVCYESPLLRHGIRAIAGMNYQRNQAQRDVHPEWDYQQRTFCAYGSGPEPLLWVDFWMKFSPSGESVVYTGRYSTRESDGAVLSHGIAEDLLQGMHEAIYRAFDGSGDVFERNLDVLSLHRYQDIGFELARIYETWQQQTQPVPDRISMAA